VLSAITYEAEPHSIAMTTACQQSCARLLLSLIIFCVRCCLDLDAEHA